MKENMMNCILSKLKSSDLQQTPLRKCKSINWYNTVILEVSDKRIIYRLYKEFYKLFI